MKIKLLSKFLMLFLMAQLFCGNTQAYNNSKVEIFSTDSNSNLSSDVAKFLKIDLSDIQVKNFKDGEISIKLNNNVTSKDCVIVSLFNGSANDSVMKLLITIDALKRNFSKSITAVIPYLEYSRQDRKTNDGEPISAKLLANLIKTAGADRVITMDIHASQEEGFFDIPVINLKGLDIFVDYFKNNIVGKPGDFVVVAPDLGASKRAREFAGKLGCTVATIDKYRPNVNESEVLGIYGNVKGKKAILIDDMVDTAGTICNASKALIEVGDAKEVYACATHALLSGDAVNKIDASSIKKFVFLDTINPPKQKLDKLTFLSSAPAFARAICRLTNSSDFVE